MLTLVCVSILAPLSLAQQRYTANRPVTTPATPVPLKEDFSEYVPKHTTPVNWKTNYTYAARLAKSSERNLLIYLYADGEQKLPEALASMPITDACKKFDTVILDDVSVRSGLDKDKYVLLKLPMDAEIANDDGTKQSIHTLPGFEHMIEHPGLVVIDYEHQDAPYYGEVVGILPFLRGECPTTEQTDTFLNLPPGTLTQRTLTYAVRIHPDRPLSGNGEPVPAVVQEATDHALYQAERGVLGHMNYGTRSRRATEELGGGSPSEICAQSQSGLSLFEGAIASMRLWRNSSGHWAIGKKFHTYYGYDMALGKNGCWYAVGFFVNQ
ncbi:MAG: hypothetical protein LBI05_05520 [Planctomycetaceae bacterium]|jgi:hypothetical protein|nr:hypothetical protein [Planctomycetaceae bacterium]